jgi:poly [ADP-ribose] polymerase
MSRPPVLDTGKQLKKKMAMLEALGDIEIATSLLKGSATSGEHPIDSSYKALNTTLEPVDKNSRDWGIVAQYIKNTHAPTHTNYKLRLKVLSPSALPCTTDR